MNIQTDIWPIPSSWKTLLDPARTWTSCLRRIRVPQKWMVFGREDPKSKWMMTGVALIFLETTKDEIPNEIDNQTMEDGLG